MTKKDNRKKEDLERENLGLRLLHEEKKDIYQRVVHDLKNHLANIHVNIHLMRVMGEFNESQNECYAILEKDIDDMTQMATSLLDLAKLNRYDALSDIQELNVGQIIQVRANQYQHYAEAKGLTINTNIPDLPLLISADPLTITSVIDNLLSNAIKYTEKGEITLTVEKSDENVFFSVKDEGVGIPKKEIPMLFNEFHRSSTQDIQEGHGLGLSLIKKIIDKYEGKIEVDSEVGKGTEFRIYLPLIRS